MEAHYVDWYQGVKGCCTGFGGVWHDQQPGQEARCDSSGAEVRYPARWRDIRSAHARSTAAGETAAGDDPRDARTGRPWLAAVRLCVFAGRAAQHRTEVVDEMRLVVPADAYRQVREVDAGVALDLKCSLLRPIAAQDHLTGTPTQRRNTRCVVRALHGESCITCSTRCSRSSSRMRSTSAVSAEYVGSISPVCAAIALSRPAAADSTLSSRCIGVPNKSSSTGSTRPVSAAASRPKRAVNPPGRNRAPTTVPRSLMVVRNTRSTTRCTSVFGSENPWRGLSRLGFVSSCTHAI